MPFLVLGKSESLINQSRVLKETDFCDIKRAIRRFIALKNIFQTMPKWVWVCLVIAASPFVIWNIIYPSNTLRYKVTVEIETPEGLKTGFAVRQVTMRPQLLLPQGGAVFDTIGEAVVVDLGSRGKVFAVMGTDDHWMFFEAFAPPPPSGAGIATTKKGMQYYKSIKERKVLDPKLWPLLVGFKDINDPKTVTVAYKVIRAEVREDTGLKVRSVGAEDHMVDLFGEGVKIKNIEVERTHDDISWHIVGALPWLKELKHRGARLNSATGAIMNNDLSNNLGSGSFSTGDKR